MGEPKIRISNYLSVSPASGLSTSFLGLKHRMVGGDTQKLLAAVQQYLQREEDTPKIKPRAARVIVRHFLSERRRNGAVRDKTLTTYAYEMRLFNSQFGKTSVSQITKKDIQAWVRSLDYSPKSKRNLMRTVKLVFDHAIKLELRTDNPAVGVELPRVNQAAPERFSADQCELLLRVAVQTKSRFLPALAIGLFTGARPAEVCRLSWEDISFEEERINIPGEKGKTHQYRWVRMGSILEAWLKFVGVKTSGNIIPRQDLETYERWRKQLCAAASITEWPHDAMRHTHASFDYAIRGEFDSVAANLGNAVTISRKHYIAPATRREAERFLKLTPSHIKELIAKDATTPNPAGDTK